jgi:hypothetical protein
MGRSFEDPRQALVKGSNGADTVLCRSYRIKNSVADDIREQAFALGLSQGEYLAHAVKLMKREYKV